MSADADFNPPGDTIVVAGGYESSDDDAMLSDDNFEEESVTQDDQGTHTMEDVEASEAAPTSATNASAVPVDTIVESTDPLSVSGDDGAEAGLDLSDAAEQIGNDPTATASPPATDAVRASSPAGSVFGDLSSASLSITSADSLQSPSESSSPPQQSSDTILPGAQQRLEGGNVATTPQAAPVSPQPAPAEELHELSRVTAAPLAPSAPSGAWPAGDNSSIEIDIQELLNGIQAASSSPSASVAPAAATASTPVSYDAASTLAAAPPAAPVAKGTSPNAQDGAPHELPTAETDASESHPSVPSLPSLQPTGSLPISAYHDAIRKAPVKPNAPAAFDLAAAPTQPASMRAAVQREGGAAGNDEDGKSSSTVTPVSTAREPPTGPRAQKGGRQNQNANARNSAQTFEQYLADERRFTSEARWERFPEGSRIFVGNLVQERVNKRDVFNLFHKYGRVAQISLKSAFGFVQYHNAADATEAVKQLQGTPVAGRKINLEITKTQKKGNKDGRDRSVDRFDRNNGKRGGSGANGGGRKSDSFDGGREGRDGGRGSDGYRPGADPQGRRGDRYGEGSGRGRHGGRSRSRSPRPYSRSDDHRQRSPARSSHGDRYSGHSRGDSHDDVRHSSVGHTGQAAADVQILMLDDVHPDFTAYVQKGFSDRGLRSDAMHVAPRLVDSVIQRQIVEGVLAVIKLDVQSQNLGKVTIQVFNRVPGALQVTFDEYRFIDINVAAELVVQKKQRAAVAPAAHLQQQPQQQPAFAPSQAPLGYAQAYAQAYPQAYPYQAPQQAQAAAAPLAANLAGVLGQMDPATLQKVLMAINTQQPQPQQHLAPAPIHSPVPPAPPAAAQQPVDLRSILSNLKSSTPGAPAAAHAPPPGGLGYGAAGLPGGYANHLAAAGQMPHASSASPPPVNPAMAAAANDPQVQSILAQLARGMPR